MNDPTRVELAEAIKQLAGDPRFQVFMKVIAGMKESAVANACADASLSNPGTTSAALGECRAYREIENMVEEYRDKLETL